MSLYHRLKTAALRLALPDRLFQITVILDIIILIVVIIIACLPQEATFIIDAKTERLKVVVGPGQHLPVFSTITFHDIDAIDTHACPAGKLTVDDTRKGDTLITMTSVGKKLMMDVSSDPTQPIGEFVCQNGSHRRAPTDLAAEIQADPATEIISIPFSGILTLGALPAENTVRSNLLVDGSVTVESSSFPFKSGRARSETPLMLGDVLRIYNGNDNHPAQSFGVIRFSGGVMNIISRAKGTRAEVETTGQQRGSNAAIAPSLIDKLRAQPEWAILLFVFAVVLNLLTVLRDFAIFHHRGRYVE